MQLEYPLDATTFSQKECSALQKSFTTAFLAKMGYNETTSRDIIFGPALYGATGFGVVWMDQGIWHLKLLMGYLHSNNKVGQIIHISYNALQLFIGTKCPVLSFPYSEMSKYANPTWLTNTWDFLEDIDGKLEIHDNLLTMYTQQS